MKKDTTKHHPLAIRPQTQVALDEARNMVGKAFGAAIKTNLAFLACSGLFAYRASQRFWERRGRAWWTKGLTFSQTALLALGEDAFGADIHIVTQDLDRALEEGRPALSLPTSPVDKQSDKKS